jgi:pyruvate formate lyase activating enzyme
VSLNQLGLIKTSLIDYPGEVAAVVFTAGCNLRCPFCHNPNLVSANVPEDFLSREEVMAFLGRRSRLLGGVCITGGEPLIHDDLGELTSLIRDLDLKIKIDTNGTFPDRLDKITPNFVALDIKTSPAKYSRLLPGGANLQLDLFDHSSPAIPDIWTKLIATLDWIIESDVEYEIRTTVVPDLVNLDDVTAIADLLQNRNACAADGRGHYVLAGFNPEDVLDPAYAAIAPYPEDVLETMAETVRNRGLTCSIRANRTRDDKRA